MTHAAFQAAVLALGPLAYWPLQGNPPAALADVSGNGHDLTASGSFTYGSPVPGWSDFQQVLFGGNTSLLTPLNQPPLRQIPFTRMALVAPTGSHRPALSDAQDATPTAGFYLGSWDALHSEVMSAWWSGTGVLAQAGHGVIPGAIVPYSNLYGMSHQFGTIEFWFNGRQLLANTNSGVTVYTPSNAGPWIGHDQGQGFNWSGGISDVAIFPRLLSVTEWNNLIAQAGFVGGVDSKLDAVLAAVRSVYANSP